MPNFSSAEFNSAASVCNSNFVKKSALKNNEITEDSLEPINQHLKPPSQLQSSSSKCSKCVPSESLQQNSDLPSVTTVNISVDTDPYLQRLKLLYEDYG